MAFDPKYATSRPEAVAQELRELAQRLEYNGFGEVACFLHQAYGLLIDQTVALPRPVRLVVHG